MMTQRQLDIQDFARNFPLREDFRDSSFLVTGGTGLIGSTLVACLLALDCNVRITLPVRSLAKVHEKLGEDAQRLNIVECDLQEYLDTLDASFDFIVHCASPTAGGYMVEHPIETYTLAIDTTRSILEYVRRNPVKGFLYVSSLEYYGQHLGDELVEESDMGKVDFSSARSSYPLGKQAAEFLCTIYSKQYGVPSRIARLTQTFGAGVAKDDNRVFAQFARSILSNDDIVLHTKGRSAKPYCYTLDCVSAMLYILTRGADGEAYNVANESTYISIYDMACMLRDEFNPQVRVRIEEKQGAGYAPETRLHLSASKLVSLGWQPRYDLKEMYRRLMLSINE